MIKFYPKKKAKLVKLSLLFKYIAIVPSLLNWIKLMILKDKIFLFKCEISLEFSIVLING